MMCGIVRSWLDRMRRGESESLVLIFLVLILLCMSYALARMGCRFVMCNSRHDDFCV